MTSPCVSVYGGQNGAVISPWHDISLKAGGDLYNAVVEIPMYTTAKLEVQKALPGKLTGPARRPRALKGYVRAVVGACYLALRARSVIEPRVSDCRCLWVLQATQSSRTRRMTGRAATTSTAARPSTTACYHRSVPSLNPC